MQNLAPIPAHNNNERPEVMPSGPLGDGRDVNSSARRKSKDARRVRGGRRRADQPQTGVNDPVGQGALTPGSEKAPGTYSAEAAGATTASSGPKPCRASDLATNPEAFISSMNRRT